MGDRVGDNRYKVVFLEGTADYLVFNFVHALFDKSDDDTRSRSLLDATYIRFRALASEGTLQNTDYLDKIVGSKPHPLWELRIKHVTGQHRLFFIRDGDTFVLLNHFIKKTAKTPPREITLAQSLAQRYFQQKEGS